MKKPDFEKVEITRQQEIIAKDGIFIQTQAIGNYICDTYRYETFYVIFFCLIEKSGASNCRCFNSSAHIELFLHSIGRSMS